MATEQEKLEYERDMTRLQEIIVRAESIKLLYMIQNTGGEMASSDTGQVIDLDRRIASEFESLLHAVCEFGDITPIHL